MNALMFALMLQVAGSTSFIVSTKAGLVNYVQGAASVKTTDSVRAGGVVGTGPGGAVELLLNPGSYLRLGESTQVLLNKADLYDIEITVIQGSALVESNGFSSDLPMTVNTGKLKMQIIKDGIFLFADGKVIVVEGKIRDASNGLIYGKGYAISADDGYRAQKVKTLTTALELWSQHRDAQIAAVNASVAKSLSSTPGLPVGSFLNVWYWDVAFGSFIYLPGYRYRSPYGYNYQYVQNVYNGGYRPANNGGGGAITGGNNPAPSNTSNAANNSGSTTTAGSYGAGGGAFGAASAAATSGGVAGASSAGGGSHTAAPVHSVSP